MNASGYNIDVSGLAAVLVVIVISGLLGGWRNWLAEDPAPEKRRRVLVHRLIEGIIASGAVPLFLSIVGTDKISPAYGKVDLWNPKYLEAVFILVGFCLIAAVFSQQFLTSLSKRVMQLSDKVDEVEKKVEVNNALADMQVESDFEQAPAARIAVTSRELTDAQIKILKALASGQFLMRSLTGLVETTRLTGAAASDALGSLVSFGLAREIGSVKGLRWALTDEGRLAVAELSTNS